MVVQPDLLGVCDEDRALVAAFQAGEQDAFDEIVRAYYPSLIARARRRLGSIRGDAEDVVQETLLRAYLALDRLGGDFNLGAWLNRILDNACADMGNRRSGDLRLRERLATRRDTEVFDTPGEMTGDPSVRRLVSDAVAALPESYRVAFVLREVEERPYAEVAEAMDVSEDNARARVHRARASLARTLRELTGAVGAIAVPFRLLVWRRHMGAANATSSGSAPVTVPTPATQLTSFSSLASGPAPQPLAQVSSSPLAQGLIASVPDLSRSALPAVSTALASLAAGAAAVLPTPGVAPVVAVPAHAAVPGHASALPDWGPPGSRESALAPVPVESTSTSRGTAMVIPSGSGGASHGSSTNSSGSPSGSAAAPNPLVGPPAQWSWVSQAATASPDGTADPNPPPPGFPASTSPCPYSQSFPMYAPGVVSVPPALTAGSTPSGSLVTNPVTLSGTNNSFEIDAGGPSTDGTVTSSLEATIGACLSQVSAPMLVANLSSADPSGGPGPVLQVEAAPLSSSTSAQGTDILYRGVGVWLSGPNQGSAPMAVVAEMTVQPLGLDGQGSDPNASPNATSPDEAVSMLVAFYGPVSDLVAPGPSTSGCASAPASGTSSSSGGGSSTTSTTTAPSSTGATGGSGGTCAASDPAQPATTSPSTGPSPAGSP